MIVHKIHQMLAPIETPLFRTVLAVQGVCDFKHIHAVETGINAFITFIVCAAVEHFVIYNQVIVSEQYFADVEQIRV